MASELDEFRLAWKRELEQQSSSSSSNNTGIASSSSHGVPASTTPAQSEKAQILSRPPPASAIPSPISKGKQSASKPAQSAVEIYGQAVQAEREGRLNDALSGYRTALRMDDKVDKLYHRLQTQTTSSNTDADKSMDDVLAFEYQRTLQLEPDYERQKKLKSRMLTTAYIDKLTTMFRATPYDPISRSHQEVAPSTTMTNSAQEPLQFTQKSTLRGIPIARLPDEILLHILSIVIQPSPNAQYPNISSLERGFALVSRKARILTLSSVALWKEACHNVYKPPLQLENPTSGTSVAAAEALANKLYAGDYRLMWIEQPRIRTDGVYISSIKYLRRGVQEGSVYTPMHYVEYYRYLCFLPSGYVVSLLSHDPPKMVVPILLSSSHSSNKQQAGYTVGRWRLRNIEASQVGDGSTAGAAFGGTIVQLTSLEDPRITSPDQVKYSFKMTCRLKSTSRGRMNKLEMLSLVARNHRTDEEAPIPVKQGPNNAMPSFFFSRVLSYD